MAPSADLQAPTSAEAKGTPHAAFSLPAHFHRCIIVGAGISGIAMGAQLQRKLGVKDFLIVEKSDSVAGTWSASQNNYPQAGCDVPAPLYSFSFRQKTDWSRFFPKQGELRDYFNLVAAEFGLLERMRLKTVVHEARFDSTTKLWHLAAEDFSSASANEGSGKLHHYVCNLFVSAVGGLSTPKEPGIEGWKDFKGPLFHSARWDHSVSLQDKNVVVVGNGCSATQFMPVVAKQAKTLTQAVRSKHWYAPIPHNPMDKLPGWRWLVSHVPFFMWMQRFIIWCVMESHFTITLLNPLGRLFRHVWERNCTKHARKLAPQEYWQTLIPSQKEVMVGCKRRILDEDYLKCLNEEHVRLERSKIARIEPDAAITGDGRRLPADVIIMANGFATNRAGFPMRVYGANGQEIREHWAKFGAGGPVNYRATLMAGFPNYGNLNGPNSATGHQSLIATSESQVLYLLEVAKPVLLDAPTPDKATLQLHLPTTTTTTAAASSEEKAAPLQIGPSFDVKEQAEEDEQYWVNKAMNKLVFSTGCGAWYQDENSGRITAMYPDWQWRFYIRSIWPNWADLVYTGLPGNAQIPASTPWWKVYGNKVLGLGTVPKVDKAKYPIKPPPKPTKA